MADNPDQKYTLCNTCTKQLVELAYQRRPLFRMFREPLALGMRCLGWWHHIDPRAYAVRTPGCYGCMRFRKTILKERSALFRWLNARVNPVFDRLLDTIVTQEEVRAAKQYAAESTHDR